MILELAEALRKEREAYPSITAMAADAGVPYDSLYALLNGTRKSTVSLDMLSQLAVKYPSVAALFLPANSPIGNSPDADLQSQEQPA